MPARSPQELRVALHTVRPFGRLTPQGAAPGLFAGRSSLLSCPSELVTRRSLLRLPWEASGNPWGPVKQRPDDRGGEGERPDAEESPGG